MAARMKPEGDTIYRVRITRYWNDDPITPRWYGCLGPFNTLSAAKARITVNRRYDEQYKVKEIANNNSNKPYIERSEYQIEYLDPDWKPLV